MENNSLQNATVIYTEDNTFNILRRTPIRELDAEYRRRMWEFYSSPEKFEEWLSLHRWVEEDFFKAGNEYEQHIRRIHRG